jgi:hypothetical protein
MVGSGSSPIEPGLEARTYPHGLEWDVAFAGGATEVHRGARHGPKADQRHPVEPHAALSLTFTLDANVPLVRADAVAAGVASILVPWPGGWRNRVGAVYGASFSGRCSAPCSLAVWC